MDEYGYNQSHLKPLWASFSLLLPFRKVTDYATPLASHSVHKQILPVLAVLLYFSVMLSSRDSIWQVIAPFSLKHFFIHFSVSLIFFRSLHWATFSLSYLLFSFFSRQSLTLECPRAWISFLLYFPSVASSRLVTSSTVWMPASNIYVQPQTSPLISIYVYSNT